RRFVHGGIFVESTDPEAPTAIGGWRSPTDELLPAHAPSAGRPSGTRGGHEYERRRSWFAPSGHHGHARGRYGRFRPWPGQQHDRSDQRPDYDHQERDHYQPSDADAGAYHHQRVEPARAPLLGHSGRDRDDL